MKTDPHSAIELVDKILCQKITTLSKEDADFLIENKEACSRKLLPILALEITQINEGDKWNPGNLFGSLKLLAAFEEKRAFDWIVQLHNHPEIFEAEENSFILLFWADILVATITSDWNKIKETIEAVEPCGEIKEACIDALLILVARGNLERSELVKYFESLYAQNLSGETYDPELLELLIEASIALWPGESMEDIRELFGLALVDDSLLSLTDVLTAFKLGKEECLEHLKSWTSHSHLLEFFIEEPSSSFENLEELLSESSLEEDEEDFEYDGAECQEDLECFENMEEKIPDPMFCAEIDQLSQKDQEKYRSLPRLLIENPEEALESASELVANYPLITPILYYFHSALVNLDAKVLAKTVLNEWREKFPDDLLAKIEQGNYFLRRHEPEKVKEIFNDTWSLVSLYPEREAFDEIECLNFFHLAGFYFLQIGNLEKAQEQMQILDATNPNSFEYYHLKREADLFQQREFFIQE
jgi:hypothetical protein